MKDGIRIAFSIPVNDILLCTYNPLLIKSFYGILRDEGFSIEIADHPALAIQMIFQKKYTAFIIDSESFGLSAEETIQIIRSISPDMPIIVAGNENHAVRALSVKTPVDLEEFKDVIHNVHQFSKI